MYYRPSDLIRLFADLFQDLPPLTKALYVPGTAILVGYPVFSVLIGPGQGSQAFVTAFFVGFSLQIAIGYEPMLRRALTLLSVTATVVLSGVLVFVPLVLLTLANDPIWCQRMQSGVYLAAGSLFLVDMVKGRVATAATLWPDTEMRLHLPNLTRAMVLFNATFLVFNETLIQTMDLSQWMVCWAALPILSQMVLRAVVRMVINLDDSGEPV